MRNSSRKFLALTGNLIANPDRWTDVPIPHANFSWVPFTIQQRGRVFRPSPTWTLASMVTQTGGDRYVKKTGSNGAAGTSWATAWATVAYAITNAPDNGVIYVEAGRYGWTDGGIAGTTFAKNLSLIGVGTVILDSFPSIGAWALTTDQTYTYQVAWTYGAPNCVLDYGALDSDGAPSAYTLKTSVSEVEAQPGSYFWISNVIYVHTLEENSPDSDVRPQYVGNAFRFAADNLKVYGENLQIYSSDIYCLPASAAGGSGLYLKNCQIMHRKSVMLDVRGIDVILQGCKIAHNPAASDALRGSASSTVVARVIEIDCTIWDIGVNDASESYNASTNHSAGKNVIINGEYYNTYGPVVGYINNGEAWMLGLYAHHCLADTVTIQRVNYQLEEAMAYLDCCSGSDSAFGFNATNNNVYLRSFQGQVTNAGAGTLQSY